MLYSFIDNNLNIAALCLSGSLYFQCFGTGDARSSKSNKLILLLLLLYYSLKNDLFFDETSKTVYNQIAKTNPSVCSRVMLNIERFELGQSYVTAKIQNRYGENVAIQIYLIVERCFYCK